jgi:predicted protein tyrosine phosphatase
MGPTTERRNVLFVCTANRQRSPTAEELYRNDRRFNVRSAGTSRLAKKTVDAEMLRWADLVVVMESDHARAIRERFPDESREVSFIVLGIPDIFHYMDTTLQREIRDTFEQHL